MSRHNRLTEEPDIDMGKLSEVEDIARGVEGSQGEVSLSPDHADIFQSLGGNLEDAIDTGSGGVLVSCVALCDIVLGPPTAPKEGDRPIRRRLGNRSIIRSEGAASQVRKAKAKKAKSAEAEEAATA